jgi:CheY-like chemotaxis protein
MSVTAIDKPNTLEAPKKPLTGAERRRRRRAKICAQLRARPAHATHLFADICKTIDVSRDGVLFSSTRKDYAKGQRLEITFPYTSAADEFNQPQMAEVIRASQHPDGTVNVAIEFLSAREESQSHYKGTSKTSTAAMAWMNSNERPVVLAIEADAHAAQTLRSALQDAGYDVLTVDTPKQALEAMRKMVPTVVIADAESPEISGHELCTIIKRDERLQSVPVILMTVGAQPADYAASHSLGAVVCMAKPFKTERLQHVVKLVAPPMAKSSYSSSFGALGVHRSLDR